MAGKLTARERAHELCRSLGVCYKPGATHTTSCLAATAVIQAHEDAVTEETRAAIDILTRALERLPGEVRAVAERLYNMMLGEDLHSRNRKTLSHRSSERFAVANEIETIATRALTEYRERTGKP